MPSIPQANIRLLGGLLSAHLLASDSSLRLMSEPYHDDLLKLAHDLGDRLLPAFATHSNRLFPYAWVSQTFTANLLNSCDHNSRVDWQARKHIKIPFFVNPHNDGRLTLGLELSPTRFRTRARPVLELWFSNSVYCRTSRATLNISKQPTRFEFFLTSFHSFNKILSFLYWHSDWIFFSLVKVLDRLWELRSSKGLFGNTLDGKTGQWLNPISGIGAGIDSFYEYLFKAYILFGDIKHLDMVRFPEISNSKFFK